MDKNTSQYDSIEILTLDEAIERYSNDWHNLVASEKLNPTILPGWLEISVNVSDIDVPIQALIVTKGQDLLAVLPFFVTRTKYLGLPFRTVNLLSNKISYHADIPTKIPREKVLNSLLEKTGRWHIAHLANVVVDGPLDSAITLIHEGMSAKTETLPVETSPYLPIDGTWDDYISTRSKKFRYKLRQRDRILNEQSSLSLKTFSDGVQSNEIVKQLLKIEASSWKAQYGLDISRRANERRYYELLLPYLATLGALHVDMLFFEEEPIAYSLCCSWNGWFGQLKTSFDEKYSEISPGSIVIDASIAAAFRTKAEEFDFLGDTDNHKRAWTEFTRTHCDRLIYSENRSARLLWTAKRLKHSIIPNVRTKTVKPS